MDKVAVLAELINLELGIIFKKDSSKSTIGNSAFGTLRT